MPGRNAPCPCGSGRKYKQCCLHAPGGPRTRPARWVRYLGFAICLAAGPALGLATGSAALAGLGLVLGALFAGLLHLMDRIVASEVSPSEPEEPPVDLAGRH